MTRRQRCVAVFRWDGPLPDFDAERDPERLTTLTARAPTDAILGAVRAGGYETDVDAPHGGEGGWHFTVRINGQTFGIFTLWTGLDGDASFAVQLDAKRGILAGLLRKRILDERLEPACRLLDEAFGQVPQAKDVRWLTDAEFEASYCGGRPLPPVAQAARPGGMGAGIEGSTRDFRGIELDGSELCPGATADAVARVERDLGVNLPAAYKEFLAFADGGGVGNFIFYSVGDGIHPAERLVAAHRRGGRDCPIVAIGRDASDDFGFLRTELASAATTTPGVHFLSHETWETVRVAPSFVEFLRRVAGLEPGEPLRVEGA
jgi:hypothetical protein